MTQTPSYFIAEKKSLCVFVSEQYLMSILLCAWKVNVFLFPGIQKNPIIQYSLIRCIYCVYCVSQSHLMYFKKNFYLKILLDIEKNTNVALSLMYLFGVLNSNKRKL